MFIIITMNVIISRVISSHHALLFLLFCLYQHSIRHNTHSHTTRHPRITPYYTYTCTPPPPKHSMSHNTFNVYSQPVQCSYITIAPYLAVTHLYTRAQIDHQRGVSSRLMAHHDFVDVGFPQIFSHLYGRF